MSRRVGIPQLDYLSLHMGKQYKPVKVSKGKEANMAALDSDQEVTLHPDESEFCDFSGDELQQRSKGVEAQTAL